jgi:3-hydroxy-3-methylglutaryl CoA synthase
VGAVSPKPRVGIEKLAAYPGSLALSMKALCDARGHDLANIRDVMMIDERSVNPEWEDPVTMAVNAALPLLTERDRADIGLLLVASESGVDQEKPMSTWVQRYLGLSSRVRNIEVKHACYGATASLQLAASWVASGAAKGEKALVINTDQSRAHFGKPWEFVMGAGAVAVVVSDAPQVLEIDLGKCGIHTHEVSDLTRPTPHVETGNSETSLLSYLDALEGAVDDYIRRCPEAADLDRWFQRNLYHVPFGGMGFRAHKAVLRRSGVTDKRRAWEHFSRKTLPSLGHVRRMGATYGGSTFLALMSLVERDPELAAGDRIGVFSYGSGSCGELWSGTVCPEARAVVDAARMTELLDARRQLTVAEYEAIESARAAVIDSGDYVTNRRALGDDFYERQYAGRGLLVFDGMQEYYRRYEWS